MTEPGKQPTVHVVGAVLIKGGRIFLVQRPFNKTYPFRWEIPGGKVEAGETEMQALSREVSEEIGVRIKSLARVLLDGPVECPASNGRPDFTVHYTMWLVDRWEGSPALKEGQPGMGWFTANDYLALPLLPANVAATAQILQAMKAFPE